MFTKKYFALGLLPVFGLMMMSPSALRQNKINSRSIAGTESSLSDVQRERQRIHEEALKLKKADVESIKIEGEPETKPEYPRYQSIVDKADKERPHQVNESLTRGVYLNNLRDFVSMIENEDKNFASRSDSKEKVEELKRYLQGLAEAIGQSDKDLKDLKDRKLVQENDQEKPQDLILSAKVKLEDLLKRTDDAAVAFNKTEAPAPKVAVVEAKDSDKKEEKTAEQPEDKVAKGESKNRREKKEKEHVDCEESKLVTAALQKFIEEQSNVMKQMLTMMQSMISMQQAQNELAQNNRLYQYNPQYPTGNWMFMPNGFQPSFSSFGTFSSGPYTPQLFGQQPVYNAGQSDQSAVTSGSWSLRPDAGLQLMDPRMTPMTDLSPGQFGGAGSSLLGNFGFDMSQQSFSQQVPQTAPFGQSQLNPSQFQPQLQQAPFLLPSTTPQFGGPTTLV